MIVILSACKDGNVRLQSETRVICLQSRLIHCYSYRYILSDNGIAPQPILFYTLQPSPLPNSTLKANLSEIKRRPRTLYRKSSLHDHAKLARIKAGGHAASPIQRSPSEQAQAPADPSRPTLRLRQRSQPGPTDDARFLLLGVLVALLRLHSKGRTLRDGRLGGSFGCRRLRNAALHSL